jgi:hypothetical protein
MHHESIGKKGGIIFEGFLEAKHVRKFFVEEWIDKIPMFGTLDVQ